MSAEVKENIDLVCADTLRLFLDGEICKCLVTDTAAQLICKGICTVVECICVNVIFRSKAAQQRLVKE